MNTNRQPLGFRGKQVLHIVTLAITAGQRAPSYANIADALGMSCKADVCNVVRRLEKRGLLNRCDTGSRNRRGWHQSVILTPTT